MADSRTLHLTLSVLGLLGASCAAPSPAQPAAAFGESDRAPSIGLLPPPRPAAQSGQAGQTSSRRSGQAPAQPKERLFGRPSWRIYGGYFEASTPEGFANETSRFSLGVGATWPERRYNIFSIDADLLWTEREFDALVANPPGPPVASRADLSTIGLSGGGRATFPVEGPVRFYGGAGLGLYWSDLSAKGRTTDFSRSDNDFSPGAYLLAGVDVTLGHLLVGLNYRRWFVESDFDAFGLENVDLGGDFFGLVIGAVF